MNSISGFSPITRLLFIGASIVVVMAGMRAFADTLNAFFLAALIAMLCAPIQSWLRKRGWSQGASLAMVLGLIILVGVLLVAFIGISANQVIRKLPDYEERFQQLETSTWEQLDAFGLSEQTVTALDSINLQSVFPFASAALRGILDSLGNILLIFLMLFYMLMDAPNIPRRLKRVLGEDSPWLTRANLFFYSVQRYMILKTVFGVIIAAVQTVVMLIMGVDFAVQWGVLAVIGLHSLLEYPLWYGPFQLAAGLSVWLLILPQPLHRFMARARMLYCLTAIVLIAMLTCAGWDYWRVSQLYVAHGERAPAYRDNTLDAVRNTLLFRNQMRFAELTTTPLTPENARHQYAMAEQLLHFSPEPRVVEKLMESATALGNGDARAFYAVRYKAAFPANDADWIVRSGRSEAP